MVATFKIGFYDPYTGIWVEKGSKMNVHITRSTSSSKNKDFDFLSLRAALEWANQKGITELYLKEIVIKSPEEVK